jgi:hypothetical protein
MGYKPANERDNWRKAAQIKAAHADAVEALRQRRDLSAAGRQRQLAALHVAVKTKLGDLREQDQQEVAEQRRQLTDELFRATRYGRTASGDLAERDAHQRCASIETPEQARQMLAVAAQLDDRSLLSRAAARRAALLHGQATAGMDRDQWDEVLAEWSASDHAPPFAQSNIAELASLHAEQNDVMVRFASDEMYRPAVPPELRNQVHRLDQLADAADPDGDQRPPSHAEQLGQQLAAQAIAD